MDEDEGEDKGRVVTVVLPWQPPMIPPTPCAPGVRERDPEAIDRCAYCGGFFKCRDLARSGIVEGGMIVRWGPWACDSCSQNGLKPAPLWEDPVV